MSAASAVGGAEQSEVGWNLLLLVFSLFLLSRPCQMLVIDRYFLCLQASHTQIRGSLETKEDIEPVKNQSSEDLKNTISPENKNPVPSEISEWKV